jgi:Arc/MetJ-type ribon-helix-helix transcriptional regulator
MRVSKVMGRMQVVLPDDLEKEFREEVFKGLGMKKGNISNAIEEALRIWIDQKKKKRSETAKKAWETRKNK